MFCLNVIGHPLSRADPLSLNLLGKSVNISMNAAQIFWRIFVYTYMCVFVNILYLYTIYKKHVNVIAAQTIQDSPAWLQNRNNLETSWNRPETVNMPIQFDQVAITGRGASDWGWAIFLQKWFFLGGT